MFFSTYSYKELIVQIFSHKFVTMMLVCNCWLFVCHLFCELGRYSIFFKYQKTYFRKLSRCRKQLATAPKLCSEFVRSSDRHYNTTSLVLGTSWLKCFEGYNRRLSTDPQLGFYLFLEIDKLIKKSLINLTNLIIYAQIWV